MAFLENDTIRLRALEPEDLDALYRWENDSSLWQYGLTLSPYSKFALREYIANVSQDIFQSHQLRLMIEEKAGGISVGTVDLYDFDAINLRAGVGILIDAAFRRKGYGFQTLQLIEEYAFRFLPLQQLYAYVPQSNPFSYKLFCKANYRESGRLQSWLKIEAGFTDVILMQKLKDSLKSQ